MRASGLKMTSEEAEGVSMHSVSGTSARITLTAATDWVSVKVHGFCLAIQHEQGCWRSHLHLARAQGVQDFRLDFGDLILLFRIRSEDRSLVWGKRFSVRFATYSQVLCEEISPGELEMTSLVELVSTDERVRRWLGWLTSHSCFLESVSGRTQLIHSRCART